MNHKTNFLIMGSCLSAQIAQRLSKDGYNYLGALQSIRTDVLIDTIRNNISFGLNQYVIRKITDSISSQSQIAIERIKRKLKQHATNHINTFLEKVKEANYIIVDNQYDLVRDRGEVEVEGSKYTISSLSLKVFDLPFFNHGLIKDNELGEIYNTFYYLLRTINPEIKLLFLQYPIVEGEDLEVTRRHGRVNRSKITASFRKNFHFLSIPLFKVDKENVSEANINHFKPHIYNEMAFLVKSIFEGKLISFTQDIVSFSEIRNLFTSNPYSNLPVRQYWKPAVATIFPLSISDLYRKKFDISKKDLIATCGSCFAQHISKRLIHHNFNFIDLEPAPKEISANEAKQLGFGIYSARYGNVYTSRQLVQLFRRAFGKIYFDEAWKNKAGHYVDPFRPNLCSTGFATIADMLEEQSQHLKKVREMFESLDVFVFTMGLTETWQNKQTGAVYPICPGVTAGIFDADIHEFVNLDYSTVLDEMQIFLSKLYEINPKAKVLLSVSPVSLTATAENRHVLLSNMASKSILRAVADQLYRQYRSVDYFPAYDIIMAPTIKSMFFKDNFRSIHEEGVDYVMSHFFSQHVLSSKQDIPLPDQLARENKSVGMDSIEDNEEFCDEVFLDLELMSRKSSLQIA